MKDLTGEQDNLIAGVIKRQVKLNATVEAVARNPQTYLVDLLGSGYIHYHPELDYHDLITRTYARANSPFQFGDTAFSTAIVIEPQSDLLHMLQVERPSSIQIPIFPSNYNSFDDNENFNFPPSLYNPLSHSSHGEYAKLYIPHGPKIAEAILRRSMIFAGPVNSELPLQLIHCGDNAAQYFQHDTPPISNPANHHQSLAISY